MFFLFANVLLSWINVWSNAPPAAAFPAVALAPAFQRRGGLALFTGAPFFSIN